MTYKQQKFVIIQFCRSESLWAKVGVSRTAFLSENPSKESLPCLSQLLEDCLPSLARAPLLHLHSPYRRSRSHPSDPASIVTALTTAGKGFPPFKDTCDWIGPTCIVPIAKSLSPCHATYSQVWGSGPVCEAILSTTGTFEGMGTSFSIPAAGNPKKQMRHIPRASPLKPVEVSCTVLAHRMVSIN